MVYSFGQVGLGSLISYCFRSSSVKSRNRTEQKYSIVAAWSTPVNLGPNVNSAANETRPSLSWDAKTLIFGTTRPGVEGVSDIYYSTRD